MAWLEERGGSSDGGVLSRANAIWNGTEAEKLAGSDVSAHPLRQRYHLNGRVYEPEFLGRFLTPAAGVSSAAPNPYTLNGNNPVQPRSTDWSRIEGPAPSYSYYLMNPSAMDTDLRIAQAAAGVVAVGTGGYAILAGGATLAGVGRAAFTTFTVGGLSYSVGTVLATGGQSGKIDLALDVFSFGYARYGKLAKGLWRTGLATLDVGSNVYQGYVGASGGVQSYHDGAYGLGTLQIAGGLLGFGGAYSGVRGLRSAIAMDPAINPLNYRLVSDTWNSRSFLNSTGFGEFHLEFAPNRVPNNPYFTRIDPNVPGRPDPKFSIDSKTFSGGELTSNGGLRNTKEFWQQWQKLRPESLSRSNRYLIDNYDRLKVSPRIDDEWINVFPEHAPFKGDLITHHHVDFGRYAIPVPGQTHVGSGGIWHTK